MFSFIPSNANLGLIQALVHRGNLLHPAAALPMLQIQNVVWRPVEVIGHEGYLLVQRLQGVATDPPTPFISTEKEFSHFGQIAATLACPLRLMRL